MLFLIFDLEVVFLYPWAIYFRQLGIFGLVQMGIFLIILPSATFTSGKKARWIGIDRPCLMSIRGSPTSRRSSAPRCSTRSARRAMMF